MEVITLGREMFDRLVSGAPDIKTKMQEVAHDRTGQIRIIKRTVTCSRSIRALKETIVMSIGFRKIFRDLWRSKGRTALAVLSIFIGVFAMGMISGLSDLLPARMMSSYRETNPAHIIIYLNGAVSDDDIAALSRLPGVAGIQGQRDLGAQWRLTDAQPLRA